MNLQIFEGILSDTQVAIDPSNILHYEVIDISNNPWSVLYTKDKLEFKIKGNILEILDISCTKEEKAIANLLKQLNNMSFVQIQHYFSDSFDVSRLKQGLTNLINSGKIEITLERCGPTMTKYFDLKKEL